MKINVFKSSYLFSFLFLISCEDVGLSIENSNTIQPNIEQNEDSTSIDNNLIQESISDSPLINSVEISVDNQLVSSESNIMLNEGIEMPLLDSRQEILLSGYVEDENAIINIEGYNERTGQWEIISNTTTSETINTERRKNKNKGAQWSSKINVDQIKSKGDFNRIRIRISDRDDRDDRDDTVTSIKTDTKTITETNTKIITETATNTITETVTDTATVTNTITDTAIETATNTITETDTSIDCTSTLEVLNNCNLVLSNGFIFNGDSENISIRVSGIYNKPNSLVTIQIWDVDNEQWISIDSATTQLFSENIQLSTWEAQFTAGEYFKEDGVLNIRAFTIDENQLVELSSFDDHECVEENINLAYLEIINICESVYSPVITIMDSGQLPSNDIEVNNYISVRTPSDAEADYDCSDNECEQLEYYEATNTPNRFNNWLAQSEFNTDNVNSSEHLTAEAQYYNAYDLGFGRDMNCKANTSTGRVSCYVSNYGQPLIDDHEQAISDAISGNNLTATVVMNYEPDSLLNKVTFAAYDGQGILLTDVPLDSQGAKPMPGLCLNCHGGEYNTSINSITDANFLPFDLNNFQFSEIDASKSRQAQEIEFRVLNKIITLTDTPDSMNEIIHNWYNGSVDNETAFIDDFYPNDWSEHKLVYDEVIKPYCRTCHVALEEYRDWDSASELKNYFGGEYPIDIVCDDQATRRMPQAELTLNKFYNSQARALFMSFMNGDDFIPSPNPCQAR